MKTGWKNFLIICVIIVLCTGCSDKKEDSKGNSDGLQSDAKKSEITFFHYKETIVDGMNKLNAAFMEDYSSIRMNQEMVATEYNTVLRVKINLNNLPDIFVTGTTSKRSIQSYIDEGLIAEISNMEIIKKLPPDIVASITNEDGSIYVLPFLNTARGIIYNEEIFKQAGIEQVPKTLSELEEACIKIEAIGVKPFAVAGAEGWSIGSIPWQVAQEAYSDREWIERMWDGKASFNENALPAFQFMDLMLKYCNENPMNMDYMSQVTGFVLGEYAMVAQGPWVMDTALELDDSFGDKARMMAIPVSEEQADTKLYIDNDAYLLISSKADLEAVDNYFMYIFEGEGRKVFANEVRVLNTFGIDFETHEVNRDIIEYINSGDIIANVQYNNMPDGFWQSNAKVMQEYIMGNITREGALELLDKEWAAMVRK